MSDVETHRLRAALKDIVANFHLGKNAAYLAMIAEHAINGGPPMPDPEDDYADRAQWKAHR